MPSPYLRLAAVACLFAGCGGRRSHPAPHLDSLRIAVPYDPETLDPHAEATLASVSLLLNVYDSLVTTDRQLHLRPGLAEYWENPDALTCVFHLRGGVTFHSGKSLRAADVIFSLDRIRNSPSLDARYYLGDVTEVSAPDDRTVLIRTKHHYAPLLSRLVFLMIVPAGSSAETLASKGDGTGPYTVAEWKKGRTLRLVRRERDWRPQPQIRECTFALGCPPMQAAAGLRSGQYQLAMIALGQEQDIASSPRHQRLQVDSAFGTHLGFDLARTLTPQCPGRPNPFLNPLVRRAIHMAIDRNALVHALSGGRRPSSQLVPSFVFGFDPDLPSPAPDPAGARALLRNAGLAAGFDVALTVRRALSEAASPLSRQLRGVGIRASVRVMEDREYFEAQRRRELTFWLDRWACTTGDASELLENAIHSRDPSGRYGLYNFGYYVNSKMDEAIEQSVRIEDPEARNRATRSIVRSLMDELTWIPLYQEQDVYGIERSIAWNPRDDGDIRVADIEPR